MKRKKGFIQLLREGRGFTLVELMVVVVILGILAATAIPRFVRNVKKTKEGAAWSDLDSMTIGMEMYYIDLDEYPDGAAGKGTDPSGSGLLLLESSTGSAWGGPYVRFRSKDSNGPKDPWGNYYYYEADSTTAASVYTLWCKGGKYDASTDYSAFYTNVGEFKSP